MASKDLITIDTSAIALVEQDGDKFLLTSKAEEGLQKFLDLKKQVEEVDKLIKEKLGNQMKALNCTKIEGEGITVIRRYYGERFEVYDPEMVKQTGFAKEIVVTKPDTKMIEEFTETTGELPEGIKLRERNESVSISEIKEKEDAGE